MGNPLVGSIVNNAAYRRGFRVLENNEGQISVMFVENSDSPFRSPLLDHRIFESWAEAINFMKLWDAIGHIRWW